MRLRAFVTTVVCGAGVVAGLGAVPAGADPAPAGFAAMAPAVAGAPSHLLLDAKGEAGGWGQKLPTGLTIALQRGFTVDPTAVPGTCTDAAADKDQCPADSQFANGTITVTGHGSAFGPNGQTISAQVRFFKGTPQVQGDPAGAVFSFLEPESGFHGASRGRIMALDDIAYGTAISFDKLPLPDLPPSLQFTIDELKMDIGAGNAVAVPAAPKPAAKKKSKKKHSSKKKKKATCRKPSKKKKSSSKSSHKSRASAAKKKRHCTTSKKSKKKHSSKRKRRASTRQVPAGGSFIVNPAQCKTGAWSIRFVVNAPDGVQVRDAAAPCSSS